MTADGISVVIPTLDAGPALAAQLAALARQSLPPAEVLVVDSASVDGTPDRARAAGARVLPIDRRDFDHGATRDRGLRETTAPIVVFLTQDAGIEDDGFLAALTAPLRDGRAAAAYARQLPRPGATPVEAFFREHSYGDAPQLRDRSDLDRGDITAIFYSNVAAAVRRDDYLAVGGFPERIIMNEDMVLCAKLLRAGRTVAYVPDARVVHSHRYSPGQQFRRYFDIGYFMRCYRPLLPPRGGSGGGIGLVLRLVGTLLRRGHWDWIPFAVIETACRFMGMKLGNKGRGLHPTTAGRLAMQAGYFRRRR